MVAILIKSGEVLENILWMLCEGTEVVEGTGR